MYTNIYTKHQDIASESIFEDYRVYPKAAVS